MLEKLNQFLRDLDSRDKPLDPYEISEELINVKKEYEGLKLPFQFEAELIAFDLRENSNSNWGLYYGPKFQCPDEVGNIYQYPNLESITLDVLEYWMTRAKQCNHYNLIIRYSDLVWEFSKVVTKNQPHIEFSHLVIDNTMLCAEKDFYRSAVRFKYTLKRALSLAIQINDHNRINKLVDAIMRYEEKVAEDGKPGLWGFSFDWLIDNKKVNLTQHQKDKIINDLEKRLVRVSTIGDGFDPFAAEVAAERLAKYYRNQNRKDDIYRVLKKFGSVFLHASEMSSPIQAYHWLHKVYIVFKDFGFKKEAEEILTQIHQLSPKIHEDLKEFEHRVRIPTDEVNRYIESIISDSPEKAFKRITIKFIQDSNR